MILVTSALNNSSNNNNNTKHVVHSLLLNLRRQLVLQAMVLLEPKHLMLVKQMPKQHPWPLQKQPLKKNKLLLLHKPPENKLLRNLLPKDKGQKVIHRKVLTWVNGRRTKQRLILVLVHGEMTKKKNQKKFKQRKKSLYWMLVLLKLN